MAKARIIRKKKKGRKPDASREAVLRGGVTQSLLSGWTRCRVAARNSLAGWQMPSDKLALRWGNMMHALLSRWYRHCYLKKTNATELSERQRLNFFNKFAKDWKQYQQQLGMIPSTLDEELAVARLVWLGYLTAWGEEDANADWMETERTFDVQWRGYRLRGRKDATFRLRKKLWLLESKTFSKLEEGALFDALNFDFQNLFYVNAGEVEHEERIAGVLYNMIRRPGLQNKKGIDELLGRLEEDIGKRPDHYFKRFEISYPLQRLKAFQAELFDKLEEYAAWLRGERPTYKNETACRGRWSCDFLSACANKSFAGYVQKGRLYGELDETL